MKRFISAIVILIITVSTAIVLNCKVVNSSEKIIYLIDNNSDTSEIINIWEKDKIIYSLLFSQSEIEEIQISVNKIETDKYQALNEIKEELSSLIDSISLNINNIF